MRKYALWLCNYEIWVVGFLVAVSFGTPRVLPLVVGCEAAFWIIRLVAHRRFGLRTPTDWPIILLLLMVPVTLWVTAEPGVTIPQVLRLVAGIGLFYAVINWARTHNRLHWLLRGVWLAGLLIALYSAVSVQWSNTKLAFLPASVYSHFKILVSDTVNPNVMASGLDILAPIVIGILLFNVKQLAWFDIALSAVSASTIALVLILTQSRGGLLAFGVVSVMLVALRWRRGWWVLVGTAVLVGAIIIWFGPTAVLNEIVANINIGGLEGRIEIWSRTIYMIQDFPFTGIGMGSYTRVADMLYPFIHYDPGSAVLSHNLFLQVAVDLGIPGLIAWLSILLIISATASSIYRYGKTVKNQWAMGLGAGLLCSQLALVTHGMVDSATWGLPKSAPLVWLVWGLTVAGWYVYCTRNENSL